MLELHLKTSLRAMGDGVEEEPVWRLAGIYMAPETHVDDLLKTVVVGDDLRPKWATGSQVVVWRTSGRILNVFT